MSRADDEKTTHALASSSNDNRRSRSILQRSEKSPSIPADHHQAVLLAHTERPRNSRRDPSEAQRVRFEWTGREALWRVRHELSDNSLSRFP